MNFYKLLSVLKSYILEFISVLTRFWSKELFNFWPKRLYLRKSTVVLLFGKRLPCQIIYRKSSYIMATKYHKDKLQPNFEKMFESFWHLYTLFLGKRKENPWNWSRAIKFYAWIWLTKKHGLWNKNWELERRTNSPGDIFETKF